MMLQATHDMGVVNAVYRHPEVWPWICDDETPLGWRPSMDPYGKEWLLAIDGEQVAGVLHLDTPGVAKVPGWAELHVAFLPGARGAAALRALRALWEHTAARGLKTVYGLVPADNRPCARMAALAGMRRLITVPGVFPRKGTRHDVWIFAKEVI